MVIGSPWHLLIYSCLTPIPPFCSYDSPPSVWICASPNLPLLLKTPVIGFRAHSNPYDLILTWFNHTHRYRLRTLGYPLQWHNSAHDTLKTQNYFMSATWAAIQTWGSPYSCFRSHLSCHISVVKGSVQHWSAILAQTYGNCFPILDNWFMPSLPSSNFQYPAV